MRLALALIFGVILGFMIGGVQPCLDLQERRGCDVNILLFCCWLGASGRPTLTAERLRAILTASMPSRSPTSNRDPTTTGAKANQMERASCEIVSWS